MDQVEQSLSSQMGLNSELLASKPMETVNAPVRVNDNQKDKRPYLDIDKLHTKPNRARKQFTRILEMADSLKAYGMINAIVVEPDVKREGHYWIVAGERRYRGAMAAGWTDVPICLRTDLDDLSHKEIELEENLQRESLEWMEQIENQRQIHELKIKKYGNKARGSDPEKDPGWNLTKTAELVGKPMATVQREISLAEKLKARPDLKEKLGNLPMTAAIRQVAQIEESERVQRLHDKGELKIYSDVLKGDCLDLIKDVATESVDVIVTDPPFGLSTLADLEGKEVGDTNQYIGMMKPEDNLDPVSAMELMRKIAPEWFRVLKGGRHLYVFHGADFFGELKEMLTAAGFEVQSYPLQWYKTKTTNKFMGYNYMACMEPILFALKPDKDGGKRRLNEGMKALLDFKPLNSHDKTHIFEKPVDLLLALIKNSTNLGDVVLDTFCGSGSTVIAAVQGGRVGIGFEKNNEHWLKAQMNVASNQPVSK